MVCQESKMAKKSDSLIQDIIWMRCDKGHDIGYDFTSPFNINTIFKRILSMISPLQ